MALTYSGTAIRQQDPDRFLLSLLAPAARRAALWALFAFNLEIAKTREVVSDSTLGRIRLQWWREAIDGIYQGQILEHAVVVDLAAAIKAYDLPCGWFEQLITAREWDVENRRPVDVDELKSYAQATVAPLNQLALKILGQEDEGVQDVSTAYALTGLLRASLYLRTQERSIIPVSNDNDHKMFAKEIVRHVKECKKPQTKYLRANRRLAQLYAQQIEKCDYDVFDVRLSRAPNFKELRIWLSSI